MVATMLNNKRLVSSGGYWESQIAYSRAVSVGDWVFVSGCTGTDYQSDVIMDGAVEQAEQAMFNINHALNEAGLMLKDVVRVRYIFPDRDDFEEMWPVIKKWFGDIRPTATMTVAGLIDETMKIEIEVTAWKQNREPAGGYGCVARREGNQPEVRMF